MRRLSTAAVVIVAAVLLTLAAGTTAAAAPATFFSSYPSAGTTYEQRPRGVKLHSGAGWELDAWQGWGRARALAHGRFFARPDVVEGGVDERGTVMLSRRVRCGTVRVYTRMTAVLDSGRTDTPATDPIAIRPRCRPVFPAVLAQLSAPTLEAARARSRPGRIVLTNHSGLLRVRWSRWGRAVAVGRGVAVADRWCGTRRCSSRGRARLRLRDPGWCGWRLLYRTLEVRGPGRRVLHAGRPLDAGFLCPS